MFAPQAAIFDVDGTLFDYQEQRIPPSTLQAIQLLRDRGVVIIVATGRSYAMLPRQLRELIMPNYYVFSNGHAVLDGSGACLHAVHFSLEDTRLAVELCRQHATAFLLNYPHCSYVYKDYPEMHRIVANLGPLEAEALLDCPEQDYHIEHQPIGFTAKGNAYLQEQLASHSAVFRVEPFRDSSEFDVFATQVHKMTGLRWLLQSLSISPEQCIAFGDGSNDVEMLSTVGMGVAMGNACQQLKAVATRVCPPSWEDGIYTMLKELQAI